MIFALEFLAAFCLVAFVNFAQKHLSQYRKSIPFWLKILIEIAILLPIILAIAWFAPELLNITYLSAIILGAMVGGFAPDILKLLFKK